jgi:hypothetical protein
MEKAARVPVRRRQGRPDAVRPRCQSNRSAALRRLALRDPLRVFAAASAPPARYLLCKLAPDFSPRHRGARVRRATVTTHELLTVHLAIPVNDGACWRLRCVMRELGWRGPWQMRWGTQCGRAALWLHLSRRPTRSTSLNIGFCTKGTDMREHVLLFCLLALLPTATIILVTAPEP